VSSSTLEAIGYTPVVKLRKVVPSGCAAVLVKLEYYNPTGSYKDRMALAMIEEAEKRGDLRAGMTVVAALQLARELGTGHTVTTVAVDTGLKYLAGDLYEL
jgi:cysteine synthase